MRDGTEEIEAAHGRMKEQARQFAEITGVLSEEEKHSEEKTKTEFQIRSIEIALKETIALIDRFVILPGKSLSILLVFWILQTYLFQKFTYCGYLALRSATPGCGKSRALKIVSYLSNGEPPVTANPTAAVLFRSGRPVTILDEVDKLRNQDKELYGQVLSVLNLGFEAGGCVERSVRTKGDGWTTQLFPVYGPKALAGIEALADTLEDRAFHIQMKRSAKRTPRLNKRKLDSTFKQIRIDFQAFANTHGEALEKIYQCLPDTLGDLEDYDDRYQDIAEPLVVLATFVDENSGGSFASGLLRGLSEASLKRRDSGREKAIKVFLQIARGKLSNALERFISTSELLEAIREEDDLAWIETGKSLSNFLRHFDLTAESNGHARGYRVSRIWLEEWAGRYA